MEYTTLTRKFRIRRIISTDWTTFNRIAGDVTHNLIKIMNDAITMNYVHIQEKFEYERINGKGSFKIKDQYGVATFSTIINRKLKEKYADFYLPGDLLEQAVRSALSTFKIHSREILKGNASLIHFRRDQPVPVRFRNLGLTEEYKVFLPFMSAELAEREGFTGRRKQSFEVLLETNKNSRIILDRILSGEYIGADSSVQRDFKGNWYLVLTYKQPVKEHKLQDGRIVGVDLGINKAAYLALNDSKNNFFIDGGEVASFRRRIRARRKSLQNQLRVCSDNRRGRGKKRLLKPLEKLRRSESNFRDRINHIYSRKIVDWAVENGASTIQMEDLTGINKTSSFLKNWDYYDLQTKIEQKANQNGIEVKYIDPKNTSRRCFDCGHISKDNRITQDIFECKNCGHRTNADLNAARNISLENIEELISNELKRSDIKEG